jgi:hypothetical protein
MSDEKYKGFGGGGIPFHRRGAHSIHGLLDTREYYHGVPFDPVRRPLVFVFQDVEAGECDLRSP